MTYSHAIVCDGSKCKNCPDVTCECLVPGLVSTNNGFLKMRSDIMSDEVMHRAAMDVIDSCPVKAISLVTF